MKIKDGIKLRKLGHNYMIVVPKDGFVDMSEVLSLNETAAFIWNKAAQSVCFSKEQAVAWLLDEYEVDEQTAAKDVSATLEAWAQFGLVE